MKKKINPQKDIKVSVETEGNTEPILKSNLFPIVGIGASAGGLEALEQFFTNLPVNSGMAYVVIQHLDPNYKGMMRELLQRNTAMPVYTATDRLKVKPDCVYIIPPNKSMSILNGSLYLFDPLETRGLRLPVDFFLRSLADDIQERSVGVILSGMGSDGSLGIRSIKEAGGIVLVQQPATAKYESMPRCAVESVVADFIAPANELAARLISIIKQPLHLIADQKIQKDTSSLEKIIILLRRQTGHDFSLYKKNTLYRRIERRMGIHQINKIASYVRYLQENPVELDILFKELLIGVTSFFRDTLVWDYLRDTVISSLFIRKDPDNIIRAWIPGCSTGEEAFSLAIIFKEAIEKFSPNKNFSLQIFATDLDSNAIERARKGVFSANIIADVSQIRLSRFFIKADDQYRVNAEIREMVVFAPQNVIKDPPFTRLDLLCCRNLMIYMDTELQK
ncbi:MAG: chemotaxis protein CheB, partial [Lentimicrobium sp.]|nr:chemotaxis protein CheB [Lentimicrobium sp.]